MRHAGFRVRCGWDGNECGGVSNVPLSRAHPSDSRLQARELEHGRGREPACSAARDREGSESRPARVVGEVSTGP